MELLAVISALEAIKKDGHQIEIYTDSQYLVNSVEKGWATQFMIGRVMGTLCVLASSNIGSYH